MGVQDAPVRRLLLTHFLSSLGEWAATVGLLVHAFKWGGAGAVGPMSLAVLTPPLACAPLIGSAMRRWRTQSVRVGALALQVSSYGMAGLAAALDAPSPIVAPFVIVGLSVTAAIPPTTAALLPKVARSADALIGANLWVTHCDSSSALVGSLLAGVIAGFGGPQAVFAMAMLGAAIGLLATTWRPGIVVRSARSGGAATSSGIRSQAAAMLSGHRWSRGVLGVAAARNLIVGSFDVLLVVLALEVLDLGDGGSGYLGALVGGGALISTVITTVVVRRTALRGALMGAVMLAALLTVVLGFSLQVPLVVVALPAIGVCMAVMDALSRTLLQRSTDPRQLGPLFAVLGLVAAAGQIAGSLLAQVTLAVGDVRLALMALGTVLAALAAISVTSLRRADDHAHVPVTEMALLSGLPMLSSLPSPVLERVARAAETEPTEPGQTIVEERRRVDSCHVIIDGQFEVTSNGRTLRTVGRGAVIGEVGLLAGIASTTSVRAVSAGAVLRIARDPFLTALTGHDTNDGRDGATEGDRPSTPPDHTSARSRFRTAIADHRRHATSDDDAHADVWLGLGAAGRAFGDLTFLEAIARGAAIAEASGDDLMLAEAASLTTVQGFFFVLADNVDPAMTAVCERALARLDSDDPARVRVLAALASNLSFSGDPGRRVELIEEASRIAADHDQPILTAIALNAEFVSQWEPSTLERRELIADRLIGLAAELDDPEIGFLGGFFASYSAVERGRLDEAHGRLVGLRRLVPATGVEYFDFLVERFILAIDIVRGAPDLPARVDALTARHADSHADTDGTWALQVGGLANQSGHLDTMIPVISTMLDGPHPNTWRAGLAIAHMMADDDAAAGRVLDQQGPVQRSYFWMGVLQCRAEVAAHLRRTELCVQLFDELVPYRGRVGIVSSGTLVVGLVSRSLGALAAALGRMDEAVDLLTEAIRDADERQMIFEAATARRLLAEVSSATGDSTAAKILAEEACVIADLHGFDREARLARRLVEGSTRTPQGPTRQRSDPIASA